MAQTKLRSCVFLSHRREDDGDGDDDEDEDDDGSGGGSGDGGDDYYDDYYDKDKVQEAKRPKPILRTPLFLSLVVRGTGGEIEARGFVRYTSGVFRTRRLPGSVKVFRLRG